jgi:RNA-directed DNA polymerase
MRAIRRQLEQHFQCRGVEFELEQQPDELEQQRRVCLRLQGLKLIIETVELQGLSFPALCEINRRRLFGRALCLEDQAVSIMKRTGFLFEKAFTMDHLYLAYLDARKGKRDTAACFRFETDLWANIEQLYERIHDGSYRPKPYKRFKVYEPKERVIYAPAFKDLVVQHAIYRVIYPIFDTTFIHASYACRKGKGAHKASDYTQRAMRQCRPNEYSLKLDIRKYFYSITRGVLQKMIERKIKDRRFVSLMMMFAEMETSVGIPIGNLLSQLYALIFLNPLDHFVKRILKTKKYVRYVDDFILIGLTRGQCLDFRNKIISFLADSLGLSLSKSTIATIKRGINFVGYRTWQTKRFIRKYSLFKFRRKVAAGDQAAVASMLGHAKRTSSLIHLFKLIKENGHDLEIPKNYRQLYHAHTG